MFKYLITLLLFSYCTTFSLAKNNLVNHQNRDNFPATGMEVSENSTSTDHTIDHCDDFKVGMVIQTNAFKSRFTILKIEADKLGNKIAHISIDNIQRNGKTNRIAHLPIILSALPLDGIKVIDYKVVNIYENDQYFIWKQANKKDDATIWQLSYLKTLETIPYDSFVSRKK